MACLKKQSPSTVRDSDASHNHAGIRTAKAEAVGQRDIHLTLLRFLRYPINNAFTGRILKIQGWRNDAIPNGEQREHGFDRARRPEQMPDS